MMVKNAGGILAPASEIESERLKRFSNGIAYEIEIKGGERRNRGFHGKVFAFMSWCFEYWRADGGKAEFMCEIAQFDYFRKELTILAGYYDYVVTLSGDTQINVRSLAFDSMTQEEFEQFYIALTNAAIRTVFNNNQNEEILNKLYSFF